MLKLMIRVFAVRLQKAWVLSNPLSAQQRLIRLGGCPGWSNPKFDSFVFRSLYQAMKQSWSFYYLSTVCAIFSVVKADKLGIYSCPVRTTLTSMILFILYSWLPQFNSKLIILQLLFKFSDGYWLLWLLQPCSLLDLRYHLRYVVYICYENLLAKGILGLSRETYLKLNLHVSTWYLAFEGQTSHFDANVLCMRSD